MDKYTCGSVSFYRCARLVTGNSRVHVCFLLLSLLTFFSFSFFLIISRRTLLLLLLSTFTAVINRWMMIPSLEQVRKRGFLCFAEWRKGKWNFLLEITRLERERCCCFRYWRRWYDWSWTIFLLWNITEAGIELRVSLF